MNPNFKRLWCEDAIISLVGPKLAPNWWTGRNLAFDNLTPNEQWDRDPSVVVRYIMGQVNPPYS